MFDYGIYLNVTVEATMLSENQKLKFSYGNLGVDFVSLLSYICFINFSHK